MSPSKICLFCFESFDPRNNDNSDWKRRRYCSPRCAGSAAPLVASGVIERREPGPCKRCGEQIKRKANGTFALNFCSTECAREGTLRSAVDHGIGLCWNCGNEFDRNTADQTFCSNSCSSLYRAPARQPCTACGDAIRRPRSKFCSIACQEVDRVRQQAAREQAQLSKLSGTCKGCGGACLPSRVFCKFACRTVTTPTKVCPICSSEFRRRTSQSSSSWAITKCCSRECGVEQSRRQCQERAKPRPPCIQCGTAMPYNEKNRQYRESKWCSYECSKTWRQSQLRARCAPCKRCGGPVGPRRKQDDGFCSWKCRDHRAVVHGVEMSVREIADLVGVGRGTIVIRMKKGTPLLAPLYNVKFDPRRVHGHKCGNCLQPGHNRRRCPNPSPPPADGGG